MIKKFIFTGKVRRTVIDTVTMSVFGYDEEEAAEKARRVLEDYPDPTKIEDVNYCYTENRAPVSIELLELEGKDGTKL